MPDWVVNIRAGRNIPANNIYILNDYLHDVYDILAFGVATLALLFLGNRTPVLGVLGGLMFFMFPLIFAEDLELGTLEMATMALVGFVVMYVYAEKG